jgi:hypothetical protein
MPARCEEIADFRLKILPISDCQLPIEDIVDAFNYFNHSPPPMALTSTDNQ